MKLPLLVKPRHHSHTEQTKCMSLLYDARDPRRQNCYVSSSARTKTPPGEGSVAPICLCSTKTYVLSRYSEPRRSQALLLREAELHDAACGPHGGRSHHGVRALL